MHILLVEDYPSVYHGLRSLLSSFLDNCTFLNSKTINETKYQIASNPNISLVITDLELDKGDWAINMIAQLKQTRPSLKIIVLSKHEEKSFLNQCLKAGTAAYLSKRVSDEDFKSCVQEVIEKGRTISATERSINEKATSILKSSFLTPQEKFNRLTAREKEVACLLYEKQSQTSVAQRLSVSPETVKTHTKNLYQKLEVDSRAKLRLFFEMNDELLVNRRSPK